MNRIWRLSLLIAGIIIVDQITKAVIQSQYYLGESTHVLNGFFNITYVRNPGAAFGFLASAPDIIRKPLFLLVPVIACVWLVYLIWQSRKGPALLSYAYALIFAGAVGNLIDRFSLGYVVDFLDFFYKENHFPAFNVADSSITIAAFLLIIDFFINLKKSKQNATNN